MTTIKLTAASKKLFLALANDAENWSGTPMFEGSKSERGNLTDLKKKGLVTTDTDEGVLWVGFTDTGIAYAAQEGIDMSYIDAAAAKVVKATTVAPEAAPAPGKKDPMARKTRAKAEPRASKKAPVKAAKADTKKATKPAVRYVPGDDREARGIVEVFETYFMKKSGVTIEEALESIVASDWTPPKSKAYTKDPKGYVRGYLSHMKTRGYIVPVEGAKS
ncbi:MAG TPA: hypothetical protein ENJ80_04310 [Gammaproteobacteria bacterium]|nr:hypothetical protein [Gammaproteobacteria bacterium]